MFWKWKDWEWHSFALITFQKVLPTHSCCIMPKRLEKKNVLRQKPRKLISNNRVIGRSMMKSLGSVDGVKYDSSESEMDSGFSPELAVFWCCRLLLPPNDGIQNIDKTVNNTLSTTQKQHQETPVLLSKICWQHHEGNYRIHWQSRNSFKMNVNHSYTLI